MFTKPKNAYSLTHTIIWDILYCYSTTIQVQLDGPQIHRIIGKLFALIPDPVTGSAIPGPPQWHDMFCTTKNVTLLLQP